MIGSSTVRCFICHELGSERLSEGGNHSASGAGSSTDAFSSEEGRENMILVSDKVVMDDS